VTTRGRPPALVVWLTVLWVLLWGDLSVANVLGGLAVALLVVVVARDVSTAQTSGMRLRPLAALRFAGHFLVELVKANLVLAWEIVTPRNRIHTGIVAVELPGASDGLVTLVADAVTLTPGTLTVEVRREPVPVLYVHVLHLRAVEDVRADVHRLRDLAERAFGSSPSTGGSG
jgi:multicomponent Na+:H+ antiporter subunit E